MTSLSSPQIHLDDDIKTAIIYSIADLGEYLVEIRDKNNQFYIEENNKAVRFGNLAEAKIAAQKHKVEKAFLALDKTYQETDILQPTSNLDRYDYMPLSLTEQGK